MPLTFDHVGIVTNDIDRAARQMASMTGADEFTPRFDDEILGVSVRFVRDRAGMVYELISPLGEKSPVARTLRAKKDLLNQIAYRTDSLIDSAAMLRELGHMPLDEAKPAKAFDGAPVQFFLSDLGFIVELIEAPNFVHAFRRGM